MLRDTVLPDGREGGPVGTVKSHQAEDRALRLAWRPGQCLGQRSQLSAGLLPQDGGSYGPHSLGPACGPGHSHSRDPTRGSPPLLPGALLYRKRRGEGEPRGRQPAMAGSVQLSREPRERSPFTPDLRGLGGPALSSGSTPDPREPGSRVKTTLGTRSIPRGRHTQEPLLKAAGSAPECQGQGFSSDSCL